MRAPMMLIHTVAAGGGSILHFDGARFRVGPDSAGADPGPRLLPPRRAARRHRRQRHAGQADPGSVSRDLRPGQNQPLDADAVRAAFAALAARDRRRPRAGGGRRRLHPDRRRQHGRGDQEDLGAARLRRHPLRAELLRRRRRPARLPRRRCARHDDGADPSALRPALGLWHGPRRQSRAQRQTLARRAARRRRARRDRRQRAAPLRAHGPRRTRGAGRRRSASRRRRPRPRPLLPAPTPSLADRRAGIARRHEARASRTRHRTPLRLHRREQAARRRGDRGRGDRRRRAFEESAAAGHGERSAKAAAAEQTRFFSQGEWHDGQASIVRDALRPGHRIAGPAHDHRAEPDHRRRARLAGASSPRTITSCCARDERRRRSASPSAPRPIRSCWRSSTISSCRSPSRWA